MDSIRNNVRAFLALAPQPARETMLEWEQGAAEALDALRRARTEILDVSDYDVGMKDVETAADLVELLMNSFAIARLDADGEHDGSEQDAPLGKLGLERIRERVKCGHRLSQRQARALLDEFDRRGDQLREMALMFGMSSRLTSFGHDQVARAWALATMEECDDVHVLLPAYLDWLDSAQRFGSYMRARWTEESAVGGVAVF